MACGQAYCVLRDPVQQIAQLYPSSTFKSLVGVVNSEARKKVGKRLPYTLHFNELGQHTLYTINKNGKRIGYVHVRPEITKWGVMEVTWSLDLNLRVKDFLFQRCRNRRRNVLEAEDFKNQIVDKSFDELLAMLATDGYSLQEGALKLQDADKEFTAAVIRCALKTIAVSQIVWGDEINKHSKFPVGQKIKRIHDIYTSSLYEVLKKRHLEDNKDIERSTVRLYQVAEKVNQGEFIVDTVWRGIKPSTDILWKISSGRIIKIESSIGWPNPEVDAAFQELLGKSLKDLGTCKTTVELSALEVLLICRESL
jgi:hypothetical protein